MKIYIIVFIFINLNIIANSDHFNPVTTIDVKTTTKGKFSLKKSPLGNINSNFLTSSLNFGLFERFEIGTAPLFYISKEHRRNYNFKFLFYNGEVFKFNFNAGELVFKSNIEHEGKTEHPDIIMSFVQIGSNIHFPNSKFKLGFAAGTSCGKINSKSALVKIYSFRCEDETGIDLQYEIKENIYLTIGKGRFRESGLTPYENVIDGYGAAITIFRKNNILSRPSIGFYNSKNDQKMILFTTTFYEE